MPSNEGCDLYLVGSMFLPRLAIPRFRGRGFRLRVMRAAKGVRFRIAQFAREWTRFASGVFAVSKTEL